MGKGEAELGNSLISEAGQVGSDFQIRFNIIDLCEAGGIPHEENRLLNITVLSTMFMYQKMSPRAEDVVQLILLIQHA